ncbi:MAG: hypothetical protein AAB372_04485 [Patescibacteria group bacterium]
MPSLETFRPLPKAEPKQKKSRQKEDEPLVAPDILSWKTAEYDFREKGADWYWVIVIIAGALIIASFFLRNFLFGVLVFFGTFALMMQGSRRPRTITVRLAGDGIHVDDRLFPYDTLESFWIFYEPGRHKELSILSRHTILGNIKIPLGTTHPGEVRDFLKRFVQEKRQEESFTSIVADWIGL